MFKKRGGYKYNQESFEMLGSSKRVMKLFLKILVILLSLFIGRMAMKGFKFGSFSKFDLTGLPYMTQELEINNSSSDLDISNPEAAEKTVNSIFKDVENVMKFN